jgi:alpha-L-fucosidase
MLLTALTVLAAGLPSPAQSTNAQPAQPAVSEQTRKLQQDFLKLRFGLFMHFNMGTFAGREWATGYEDPAIFAPSKLDCGQWADAARAAGMKYAVLTVKHTGGWCLWDSAVTTHDISSFVNYKGGKGDIVREFVDAFRARGLKVGFYYCFPGDFSEPQHTAGAVLASSQPDLHGLPPEAANDYVGFIKKQMTELLSNYGPIDLLWIDQFSNKYTVAKWHEIMAHLKSLQPNCLVLGNNARSLRDSDLLSFESPLGAGFFPPEGNTTPGEACDTIQGHTWFWHPSTAQSLKSAREVVDLLRKCNARDCNYLLNVPPDRDGLISGPHLQRLREIGKLYLGDGQGDTLHRSHGQP